MSNFYDFLILFKIRRLGGVYVLKFPNFNISLNRKMCTKALNLRFVRRNFTDRNDTATVGDGVDPDGVGGG